MGLYSNISSLKGVGTKRSELLSKMGINTIYDLLTYYPRNYEDWSKAYAIKDAPLNTNICIKAYVGSNVRMQPVRKGMTIYKLDATDGESLIEISFFNNKYAANALRLDTEYIFWGKITTYGKGFRSMTNPQFTEVTHNKGLNPVYPLSAGISNNQLQNLIKTAFDSVSNFDDCLPQDIKDRYCLMSFSDAIKNVHFPDNFDLLAEAKRRLVFEELLLLQIGLLRLKQKRRKKTALITGNNYTDKFISTLPFNLTNAQIRAINECVADMQSGLPMNRLLQGDVGSGKTAVSAAVIYNAVKNGYQTALMAPTEVLATQHYNTFNNFFSGTGIRVSLLVGSTKNKKALKESLKNGEIDVLIGTHALIQEDVVFNNLGLTVTDEQHRFGVNQRGLLNKKGDNPHVLVMSATPIPRTLSFIIYGDLDLSILDEMPKGRQKTDTFLIDSDKRERAYAYIKKHLIEGRQGYIVCPLVEEDEEFPESDMKASAELFKELSNGFFKGFKLGLLYGKMKAQDKKEVMDKFSSGEIDLLISTTVIEVGVDVPNAVIMVIENAERFGLAQLHQLRGRVGRGKYKSTCIMVSDSNESERLKILVSTNDGFKIADEDLKLRGPGDIFGSRQHGLPSLKVSSLMSDGEVIRETHTCAENLLKENPTLEGEEYNILKKYVNSLFTSGITLS